MKQVLLILICIFSLNAKSVEELYNELSYLNNDFLQKKLAENYKKYGKENQSIQEYEKQFNKYLDSMGVGFSEANINKYLSKTKNKSILDRDYFQVKNIEDENISNALDKYYDEIHERALQNKPFISADEWLEKRAYKLENLGSKLQSYYAMLNAIDTKQSYEKNAKELGLELTKESFINTMLSSHFNEYELSKNNDNETIVKDKALGLSANVGDIESFNYYTLKAFILNYLASILGLIIGIILCVKYKDKKLIYISPFVLLALGLVIDYFVIGIKLLKYV